MLKFPAQKDVAFAFLIKENWKNDQVRLASAKHLSIYSADEMDVRFIANALIVLN